MFGSLGYAVGNVNCELAAAGGSLPSSGLAVSTAAPAGQTNATGGVGPQVASQPLDDGNRGTNSCYQQLPVGGYGTPSLQFLQQQQHTLQQMYNNPQQVYNIIQPVGGHLQLQTGAQTHLANAQSQLQSQQGHHVHAQAQTQAVQLLGTTEQFLLDDMTAASTTHLVGPNVTELGVSLNLPKGRTSPKKDKTPKGTGTVSLQCHVCGRDFKNRSLLKKHISTIHDRDTVKQAATQPVHSRLWCVEASCEFQSEDCGRLAVHLEESHGRHLQKVNLHLSSLREFYKWKNNLEETSRVKFILTSGSIVRTRPDSANFVFECHRSATLGVQHRIKLKSNGVGEHRRQFDVMEKAVQEILPTGLNLTEGREQELHLMEVIEENIGAFRDIDESSKRGRSRNVSLGGMVGVPCCAHIEVQISLISGGVVASGCISHVGHDPEEKIRRPPDCVLGKLKGMMHAGRCREDISAGMSAWTKHHMSQGSWTTLEKMDSMKSDLFPHIRALVKKIFEHVAVITRLTSEHYWVDFMETLADMFEVERRMGVIRTTVEDKLQDAGDEDRGRANELADLETELCYCLLSHGTNRHQARKMLKYGLDYFADCRLGDERYHSNISSVLQTPIYDPSASLFKQNLESVAAVDRLQELCQRNQKKDITKSKKRKYYRKRIGSEDDSDYDCWSDDELEDIIPRRWPPPAHPKPSSTSEEKRLEKNLKRKQVPLLSVDPILKEKILAMRVTVAHSHEQNLDEESGEEITISEPKKRGGSIKLKSATKIKMAKAEQDIKNGRNAKMSSSRGGNKLRPKRQCQRRKKLKTRTLSLDEGEEDDSAKCPKFPAKDCIATHRRKRQTSTEPEVAPDDERADATDEKMLTTSPVVIQEITMDGPAGKKPRIVKILATEPGQSVGEATIVVEAPPPTPRPAQIDDSTARKEGTIDNLKRTPMVSLLRQRVSVLKAGRSVLKQPATVSLLKPREPPASLASSSYSHCIEDKAMFAPVPHVNGEQFFERELQQNFDEGPLQTPQPPRLVDD